MPSCAPHETFKHKSGKSQGRKNKHSPWTRDFPNFPCHTQPTSSLLPAPGTPFSSQAPHVVSDCVGSRLRPAVLGIHWELQCCEVSLVWNKPQGLRPEFDWPSLKSYTLLFPGSIVPLHADQIWCEPCIWTQIAFGATPDRDPTLALGSVATIFPEARSCSQCLLTGQQLNKKNGYPLEP